MDIPHKPYSPSQSNLLSTSPYEHCPLTPELQRLSLMAIQGIIKIDAPGPVAKAQQPETSKPSNWFALPNVPLREPRKIRLITVGAGFSGLMMAYNIQHKFKLEETHIDHQIYEKNVSSI